MQDGKIIKFTKIILDVMYYSGILVFLTLPVTLKLIGKYYSEAIRENYGRMYLILGLSAVFAILILGQLRKMMKTVMEDHCFVWENVESLQAMSKHSFKIAILFILKLLFQPTPATCIIIIVFFVAALFCIVLACVFSQAIRYKEENDLTI